MGAFIVALALAVSVAVCMVFLALFTGVSASFGMLASAALGLFMIAGLFAAISALGPKFRPTPLLTPTMAGTIAALVTTVAIVLASSPLVQGQRMAGRANQPPATIAPAPPAPPPMAAMPAPSEPLAAPIAPPPPAASADLAPTEPMIMPAPETPPARVVVPTAPGLAEQSGTGFPLLSTPGNFSTPIPATPPDGVATDDGPVASPDPVDNPVEAPIFDSPPPPPVVAAIPAEPAAPAPIPIPPIPPRPGQPAETLVLSEDLFDPAALPAALTRPGTVIPPLPRSRPCGAGGPPCP